MSDTIAIGIAARGDMASLSRLASRTEVALRPVQRIASAGAKLGDTGGLERVARGMMTLNLSMGRAIGMLERVRPMLGAVTGAATIAEVVTATEQWAKTGQSLANMAYRLNTPVEAIGSVRGAIEQVGGSIDQADAGMRGLQSMLSAAAWGRSSEAMQAFRDIHLNPGDPVHGGQTMKLHAALGAISEALEGKSADAQARELARLGLAGDAWLKALGHGRAYWEGLLRRSRDTGGVMTQAMVDHAERMAGAWARLELALVGVRDRIIEKWSPWISGIIERLTTPLAASNQSGGLIRTIARTAGWQGDVAPAYRGRAGGPSAPVADTEMNPARKSFLETLAAGESGGADPYNAQNPTSTAHGRYQFIASTLAIAKAESGIQGDDPVSQDRRAWYWAARVYRRKTGRDLDADWNDGNYASVAEGLRDEWPSLPGGSQQNTSMRQFVDRAAANKARYAPAKPEAGGTPMVIGDSIAVGVGHAHGYATVAEVGKSPQWVLDRIQSSDADVRGRDVILSSGASNDPRHAALVAQQIAALYAKGARSVRVLGVGDRADLAGVNETLRQAASGAGGQFLGPLRDLAGDRVHPAHPGDVPLGAPELHVEVRVRNAPPGTTADVASSGAVRAGAVVN